MMAFFTHGRLRHGRLKAGVAAGLLVAGLAGSAGAQAPGPVSTGGNSFKVNADVDTYFYAGYGGLVEPPAGNTQGGVAVASINDETYSTFLLPNLNGATFANADFNIYSDPSNNGTGPFSFRQPDFNANLLVAAGPMALNQGETDDNMAYNIGTSMTSNTYTNNVENNLTYTQIEHNFFLPTGNGNNHYGYMGYVSTSSSAGGAAAGAALTSFINSAESAYKTAPNTPVYVTFTFDSDNATDTGPGAGMLSAYAVDGLDQSSSTGAPIPEYLSYSVVPAVAPAPEPAAWTTLGLGIAAVAGRLLMKKRALSQD